jgi:hypothetical protein
MTMMMMMIMEEKVEKISSVSTAFGHETLTLLYQELMKIENL